MSDEILEGGRGLMLCGLLCWFMWFKVVICWGLGIRIGLWDVNMLLKFWEEILFMCLWFLIKLSGSFWVMFFMDVISGGGGGVFFVELFIIGGDDVELDIILVEWCFGDLGIIEGKCEEFVVIFDWIWCLLGVDEILVFFGEFWEW